MAQLLSPRVLAAFAGGAALTALVTGIPTDVIPNPWFQRMTPVRTLDVVMLPLLSLVVGSLLATYAVPAARASSTLTTGGGSGLLGVFAIGCPVCNKLVVLVLGFSGALTYFEPIQPLLALAALGLAAFALRRRLEALVSGCPMTPAAVPAAQGVDSPR